LKIQLEGTFGERLENLEKILRKSEEISVLEHFYCDSLEKINFLVEKYQKIFVVDKNTTLNSPSHYLSVLTVFST
jgi:hypothetical protein